MIVQSWQQIIKENITKKKNQKQQHEELAVNFNKLHTLLN